MREREEYREERGGRNRREEKGRACSLFEKTTPN